MNRIILILIALLVTMLACGDPETDPRVEMRRKDRNTCIIGQQNEFGKSFDEAYDNCRKIMELPLSTWGEE